MVKYITKHDFEQYLTGWGDPFSHFNDYFSQDTTDLTYFYRVFYPRINDDTNSNFMDYEYPWIGLSDNAWI